MNVGSLEVGRLSYAKMIVDIAFALDCTGSMQGWIDAAKQQIRTIVTALTAENPGATFRVGAVLYRDFGDNHSDFNRFRLIPFTENVNDFHLQFADVYASGGHDEAEDVAGAFRMVNQLDWSGDVRTLFHITDAPPHGLRYHEVFVGDRFPDVDPDNGNLEAEVVRFAEQRITLVVIKANESVNKMIVEFADIYGRTPGSVFRVQNLEGQATTTTPPRMRRDVTFAEPPPVLRHYPHMSLASESAEVRTLTRMISATVSDSIASWSAHSDPAEL